MADITSARRSLLHVKQRPPAASQPTERVSTVPDL